jgi:hypothetical protein
MTKKIGLIAIVVLVAIGIFVMGMRRASMMNGGAGIELVAVSSTGEKIIPAADVTALTGKLPKNTVAQKSGDMIVSLALNPYPPSAGQPIEFNVALTDLNGKAIDDAIISLNLTMPSMWMPPNQPDMQFVSGGKYNTTAPFTMRGAWRIEVVITRDGNTQSVFFDVGL